MHAQDVIYVMIVLLLCYIVALCPTEICGALVCFGVRVVSTCQGQGAKTQKCMHKLTRSRDVQTCVQRKVFMVIAVT